MVDPRVIVLVSSDRFGIELASWTTGRAVWRVTPRTDYPRLLPVLYSFDMARKGALSLMFAVRNAGVILQPVRELRWTMMVEVN